MSAIEEIRRTLVDRMNALQARTTKVEKDLRRLPNADSQERAQEAENDEVLEDLDAQGRSEIEQIQRALARVEAGSYGTCASCGEPIPEKRLQALPYSTQCVGCAA